MLVYLRKINWLLIAYKAWVLSIVAILGSLYFSEMLHLPICPLCWYQRIAMYPLVIIFAVGILLKDRRCFYYALPLISVGSLIALYQVLLQAGIVKELVNCGVGVSCAKIDFFVFGVFTLPQLSLLAFLYLGLVCVVGLWVEE